MQEFRSRRGDTTSVEVKAAVGGCPDVTKTLCAFGNMPDGGTFIFGLDERAGFVPTGVVDLSALEQGVASQARDGVEPPLQCRFETVDFEGVPVLVCEVDGLPLSDRPARCRSRAYLRQADGDYVMSEQEILQIELAKTQGSRRTHPDREPIDGTSRVDLDADLTADFITATRSSSHRHAHVSDDDVLRRTGVVTADGRLTLAGVYALGDFPQQFVPCLGVTAAVQHPHASGPRTGDLTHLDGPLPDLLQRAQEWVRRNIAVDMGYDSRGQGLDIPELPLRAVREVIANALVHRNLDAITDSKSVDIRLLRDRLVVSSPGGLWGVSEDQLGQPGGKSAVNAALYDICRRARLPDGSRVIEGEGGGIREVREEVRAAGLPAPRFIDTGVRFIAVLWRRKVGAADGGSPAAAVGLGERTSRISTSGSTRIAADARWGTDNERHVWEALTRPLSVRELSDQLALTERQVRYALGHLRESGAVERCGRRGSRLTTYRRREDGSALEPSSNAPWSTRPLS